MRVKKVIAGATAAAAALAGGVALAAPAQATGGDRTIAGVATKLSSFGKPAGQADRNPFDFDLLLTALGATELTGAVADPAADLTVVAPTDAAFIRLADTLDNETRDFSIHNEQQAFDFFGGVLGTEDGKTLVTDVLLYHVSPGAKSLRVLGDTNPVPTLNGATFDVRGFFVDGGSADARVVLPNVPASNGVIHVINQVILP
jgi:uncharacterized surface protein with fasciclin (FAS1) repeats